jgi:hypothetical protein
MWESNSFFENIDMSENTIIQKVMQNTSDYSKAWLQDQEMCDKSYTKIRNHSPPNKKMKWKNQIKDT